VNVIGGLGWLLEALRDCRNRRQKPGQSAEMEADSGRMYRVVDLVLSQSLALYALATLLWLPLLQEVFLPPSEQALQYLMPAVCVAVGRHVFFCCRGWRAERGLVASLTHAVSAVCLLLFLHTGTTLLLAALMMMTELGSLYTQLAGLLGERRAARCPSWVPPWGSCSPSCSAASSTCWFWPWRSAAAVPWIWSRWPCPSSSSTSRTASS